MSEKCTVTVSFWRSFRDSSWLLFKCPKICHHWHVDNPSHSLQGLAGIIHVVPKHVKNKRAKNQSPWDSHQAPKFGFQVFVSGNSWGQVFADHIALGPEARNFMAGMCTYLPFSIIRRYGNDPGTLPPITLHVFPLEGTANIDAHLAEAGGVHCTALIDLSHMFETLHMTRVFTFFWAAITLRLSQNRDFSKIIRCL